MKAKVTLTFDIDSEEYHSVKPTEYSIRQLIEAMLKREADLPNDIDIEIVEI
jgi:hypothetical protein